MGPLVCLLLVAVVIHKREWRNANNNVNFVQLFYGIILAVGDEDLMEVNNADHSLV